MGRWQSAGPLTHLLVTNDFPPKVGGIQVYLWELWSRLDPEELVVLTAASDASAASFDARQARRGMRIEREQRKALLPSPSLAGRVRDLASESGASLVVIDPAFPLGMMGPSLGLAYAVVLHGAEVTVPGHLPAARQALGHVLSHARLVVSAGSYPEHQARRVVGRRMPASAVIPPGVDTRRFVPLDPDAKARARIALGLPAEGPLVVSVSRLVPRKGMDVLIRAAASLLPSFPDLTVAIGGQGRDMARLERLVEAARAPVRFLGSVQHELLPVLYGAGDVFAMACRDRWLGLEQEGFGIVFLEAASCGVPQVAGLSGGSADAVVDGVTGFVVKDPTDAGELAHCLRKLLSDGSLRRQMGEASRRRVEEYFAYDPLARRLAAALHGAGG
ncbi:MAG: glycosyltransferase family 4 protein [Acidimicrobiales bacterium]